MYRGVLWCAAVYYGVPRGTLVCRGVHSGLRWVLWCAEVYSSVPMYTLVCRGVLWCAEGCSGVPRGTLVCRGVHSGLRGVLWCAEVYSGVPRCTLVCRGVSSYNTESRPYWVPWFLHVKYIFCIFRKRVGTMYPLQNTICLTITKLSTLFL